MLDRTISGRWLFVLFLLYLLFSQVIFSKFDVSADKLPDLKKYYTAEQLYSMLDDYSTAEKKQYILLSSTADTIYPIVYSLFLFVLISLMMRYGQLLTFHISIIRYIPFAAALFDLFENISIMTILIYLPDRLITLAFSAGIFTLMKWSFIYISEGIAILLIGYSFFILVKKRIV